MNIDYSLQLMIFILEDFNPTKKRKLLAVFHDKIAVTESKTKLDPIVTTALYRIGQQK